MKKVYLLSDEDLQLLLTSIDRDPTYGNNGGSSQTVSEADRKKYDEVHRFYNYQVTTWVEKVRNS